MADLVNNGQKRSAWSSKFGFLMAAVGSAVGLGNIWRFPYIAGQYGGAIFLIIYIIVVAVLGFSMLTLEFVIGRNRNANVLDAFEMGKKKKITPIGWLCIFTPFLIVSYYNVIGGWIVKYLVGYIGGGGFVNDTGDYSAVFGNFISDPVWSSVFTVIFIALCAVVLIFGVQKGIEKVSKVLMPALFFILVFVAIVSLTMDGALEGLKYLFVPNFESMEEYGILNILNAAMGQAFFSLSVGMGIAVTYGSYLKKDQNIPKSAAIICGLDTLVAVFAGLAIIPAVFSAGIAPTEGTGLVFVALPAVFKTLGGFGIVIAVLFFVLILFAAWTSAISLLEVLIAAVEEKTKLGRKGSTALVVGVVFVTSIIVSLSQGDVIPTDLLTLFDNITNKILLPVTGILMCIFLVAKIGMQNAKDELLLNCKSRKWADVWGFIIKFVTPILIAFIFVMGILSWAGVTI